MAKGLSLVVLDTTAQKGVKATEFFKAMYNFPNLSNLASHLRKFKKKLFP